MSWLARLSLLLGVNAVPVVGVAGAGWTNATALVLYWCETVILVLLVALRIRLHRRWTNKRGHYCEGLVKITRNGLSRTERSTGHGVTHLSNPREWTVAKPFQVNEPFKLFS